MFTLWTSTEKFANSRYKGMRIKAPLGEMCTCEIVGLDYDSGLSFLGGKSQIWVVKLSSALKMHIYRTVPLSIPAIMAPG